MRPLVYQLKQLVKMAHAQKWTKEEIAQMMQSNQKALIAGLLRIYNHQTLDEQSSKNVKYHNGIGFKVQDATILTSIAQYYLRYNKLSEKQLALVQKKMMKYAGQLAKYANTHNPKS